MIGIEWDIGFKKLPVYPDDEILVNHIVLPLTHGNTEIVFGYSPEYGYHYYVLAEDGTVWFTGNRVLEFIELDYEEFMKILKLANEVNNRFYELVKKIHISSKLFKLDEDELEYGTILIVPTTQELFINFVCITDHLDEYLSATKETVIQLQNIITELENSYNVKIIGNEYRW